MSEKGRGEDRKEHRTAGLRRVGGAQGKGLDNWRLLHLVPQRRPRRYALCSSSNTTNSTVLRWRANDGDIQGRSLDILRRPRPATAVSDRCVPESNPAVPCLLPRRRQAVRTRKCASSLLYSVLLLIVRICRIVWEYMVRCATRVPVAAR